MLPSDRQCAGWCGDRELKKHGRYEVGQVVHHLRFGYRGVIVGVDQTFQLSDEWYDQVAITRPPRSKPWYQLLVHDAEHTTYVAERHIELDPEFEPVEHPLVEEYFSEFRNGKYVDSCPTH